jgi:hypothetical protein
MIAVAEPTGRTMPAFIKNLTFDCVDALRVARFWAAALGSDVDEDSSPQRAYVEAPAWGGRTSGSGATVAPRWLPTGCIWTCVP